MKNYLQTQRYITYGIKDKLLCAVRYFSGIPDGIFTSLKTIMSEKMFNLIDDSYLKGYGSNLIDCDLQSSRKKCIPVFYCDQTTHLKRQITYG